jgi:hypothetical protein
MLGCMEWHKGHLVSMLDAKWHSDRVYIRQCRCHGCVCSTLGRIWLLASGSLSTPTHPFWSSCLQMPHIGYDDGAALQHCETLRITVHYCVTKCYNVIMCDCVSCNHALHVTMCVFLWLSEVVRGCITYNVMHCHREATNCCKRDVMSRMWHLSHFHVSCDSIAYAKCTATSAMSGHEMWHAWCYVT